LGYGKNQAYLTEMIQEFQRNGIRTSIFVDPHLDMIEGAKQTGTDRIEPSLLRMNMV
jgi:pyridoxine 5-phosphate synthase